MMLYTTQKIIKNKNSFLFIERAKKGRVQEYEIDAKNGRGRNEYVLMQKWVSFFRIHIISSFQKRKTSYVKKS